MRFKIIADLCNTNYRYEADIEGTPDILELAFGAFYKLIGEFVDTITDEMKDEETAEVIIQDNETGFAFKLCQRIGHE